jgi:hypothetical protein
MFEDPTGGLLPFEIEEWVGAIRAAMNKGEWHEGHLLAHIHKVRLLIQFPVVIFPSCD